MRFLLDMREEEAPALPRDRLYELSLHRRAIESQARTHGRVRLL